MVAFNQNYRIPSAGSKFTYSVSRLAGASAIISTSTPKLPGTSSCSTRYEGKSTSASKAKRRMWLGPSAGTAKGLTGSSRFGRRATMTSG